MFFAAIPAAVIEAAELVYIAWREVSAMYATYKKVIRTADDLRKYYVPRTFSHTFAIGEDIYLYLLARTLLDQNALPLGCTTDDRAKVIWRAIAYSHLRGRPLDAKGALVAFLYQLGYELQKDYPRTASELRNILTTPGNIAIDDPVLSLVTAKPATQRKISMFGFTPLEKNIVASLAPRKADGTSGYEELIKMFLDSTGDDLFTANYQSHMEGMINKGVKLMPHMTPLGVILRGATAAITTLPDQIEIAKPDGKSRGKSITVSLTLPSFNPAPSMPYRIPMYESPIGGITQDMVKSTAGKLLKEQRLVTTDDKMLLRLTQVVAYEINVDDKRIVQYETNSSERDGLSVTDVFLNVVKDAMIKEGVKTVLSDAPDKKIRTPNPGKGQTSFPRKAAD